MNELIKIQFNKQGEQVVSGRVLHEFLEVKTEYRFWIKRMIEYGFVENVDFISFVQKCTKPKGGRSEIDHILSMDMAKELCMLQRTEKGKQARRYFIEVEKKYKNDYYSRKLSKAIRRSLTDSIKEYVPESPHKKFAYKNFTDLVYKTAFGKSCKKIKEDKGLEKETNLREFLSDTELKKIGSLEKFVDGCLAVGMSYEDIKTHIRLWRLKRLEDYDNGKSLFD